MSSLETSVTLEDIFTVVGAKRVPLAPELAGYLALEIADGTDAGGGNVDPRTVYVSEEGTVALVRLKSNPAVGDAETSVRGILAHLLDASGSQTPALTAAAKRRAGMGLPALVEELEAALIPVNRSAGRRALARLAREVKRVTLGVGRNASLPSPALRPPGESAAGPPSFSNEPTTRRAHKAADVARAPGPRVIRKPPPPLPSGRGPAAGGPREVGSLTPPPRPPGDARHARPVPPPMSPRATRGFSTAPPPVVRREPTPPPPPAPREPERPPTPDKLFKRDEVDDLLASFEVSNVRDEKEMSRDLKALVGLDPTPPPPDAKTITELTRNVRSLDTERVRPNERSEDGVEMLLAMADRSVPPSAAAPPPAMLPPQPLQPPTPPPPSAPPPMFAPPASPFPGPPAYATPPPRDDLAAPVPPPAARHTPRGMRAVSLLHEVAPPSVPPPSSVAAGAPRPPEPAFASERRGPVTGREPRAPKTGMAMLFLALIVVIAGGVAVWWKAPYIFTGRRKAPRPPVSAVVPTPPPPRCKMALVLSEVPVNAEILLRMGQAPVDVERMPVGTRLEFVGTAEGYAPRRAIVKADSTWDRAADGKPRIDVPIQLDPSAAKPGHLDAWPAAEPGSQVGGSGAPGTVHVVSNVRGAEIWLLAGLGPDARIEQLRCDDDVDVLLAGPPALRKRLHVAAKDIQAAAADPQGNKVISLSGK